MKWTLCLVVAALGASLLAQPANQSLLDAIRADDAPTIAARVAAHADVNARDDTGATPLMYAAIYSSIETMRLLIDGGADVNASNAAGATALMWSASDPSRIRLLLQHGAHVGAKASNGATALLAAIRSGSADAARALVSAGGNAAALKPSEIAHLVYGGTAAPEMQQTLAAAGAHLGTPEELTSSLADGDAIVDLASIQRLVAAGAKPGVDLRSPAGSIPILGLVAYSGDVVGMRRILDRGVDPNAGSSTGVTPLMMAALSTRGTPEMIQLLLSQHADAAARDANGRSALDWAQLRGETPVARVLRDAGAGTSTPAQAPLAIERPRAARDAIAAALARLEPAGPGFARRTRCISCHNQSLPLIAAARASARGIATGAAAANAIEPTLSTFRTARESLLLSDRSVIGGFVATTTYGLASLADARVPPNLVTDAVALRLAAEQRTDGSWTLDDLRPPLGDLSPMPSTALAIRGLAIYLPAGRRAEWRGRVARAGAFVRNFRPASTQDHAFRLLALGWSDAPKPDVDAARGALLALQRNDGGWAQLPTMAPDAYATGQALTALRAAGVAAKSAAYIRGVDYLLRTQLEDGTWFVRSRALGFQAYFETGFPHGRNQFISAAATSWAAIALVESLP